MRLIRLWVVLLFAGNVLFIYGYMDSDFDLPDDGIYIDEKINNAAINGGNSLILFGIVALGYDIITTQYRDQAFIHNKNSGINHHKAAKNEHHKGQKEKIIQVSEQTNK